MNLSGGNYVMEHVFAQGLIPTPMESIHLPRKNRLVYFGRRRVFLPVLSGQL